MKIQVAHSPDADDAFMFYPLARGKVDTEGLEFTHTLQEIQQCNADALRGRFDVTAISFASYPVIAKDYLLLSSGASMGEKDYGPLLVARESIPLDEVAKRSVAIPGEKTTAALLLKLFCLGTSNTVVLPFDRIMDAVKNGKVDIGLLIHEGQLTYQEKGLVSLLNFGEWWWEREKLPLPLGGNVVRRSLEPSLREKIDRVLRRSIQYALRRRGEALDYALQFARDIDPEKADRFVGMYVNGRTLGYGPTERRALERLLSLAADFGLVSRVIPEFQISGSLGSPDSDL